MKRTESYTARGRREGLESGPSVSLKVTLGDSAETLRRPQPFSRVSSLSGHPRRPLRGLSPRTCPLSPSCETHPRGDLVSSSLRLRPYEVVVSPSVSGSQMLPTRHSDLFFQGRTLEPRPRRDQGLGPSSTTRVRRTTVVPSRSAMGGCLPHLTCTACFRPSRSTTPSHLRSSVPLVPSLSLSRFPLHPKPTSSGFPQPVTFRPHGVSTLER